MCHTATVCLCSIFYPLPPTPYPSPNGVRFNEHIIGAEPNSYLSFAVFAFPMSSNADRQTNKQMNEGEKIITKQNIEPEWPNRPSNIATTSTIVCLFVYI